MKEKPQSNKNCPLVSFSVKHTRITWSVAKQFFSQVIQTIVTGCLFSSVRASQNIFAANITGTQISFWGKVAMASVVCYQGDFSPRFSSLHPFNTQVNTPFISISISAVTVITLHFIISYRWATGSAELWANNIRLRLRRVRHTC